MSDIKSYNFPQELTGTAADDLMATSMDISECDPRCGGVMFSLQRHDGEIVMCHLTKEARVTIAVALDINKRQLDS